MRMHRRIDMLYTHTEQTNYHTHRKLDHTGLFVAQKLFEEGGPVSAQHGPEWGQFWRTVIRGNEWSAQPRSRCVCVRVWFGVHCTHRFICLHNHFSRSNAPTAQ